MIVTVRRVLLVEDEYLLAAGQVGPFASKLLGEQPLAALVGAAAIGFVLGVLWSKVIGK